MKASQTHHQKQYCRKGGNHKCGSGLAREGVMTFNISVDCYTAFASKPAPTFLIGVSAYLLRQRVKPSPIGNIDRSTRTSSFKARLSTCIARVSALSGFSSSTRPLDR